MGKHLVQTQHFWFFFPKSKFRNEECMFIISVIVVIVCVLFWYVVILGEYVAVCCRMWCEETPDVNYLCDFLVIVIIIVIIINFCVCHSAQSGISNIGYIYRCIQPYMIWGNSWCASCVICLSRYYYNYVQVVLRSLICMYICTCSRIWKSSWCASWECDLYVKLWCPCVSV